MKHRHPFHPSRAMVPAYLIGLGLWSLLQVGCLTNDKSNASGNDLFPQPLGEKIIPLENQPTFSDFRYVELDGSGAVSMRQALTLTLSKRGADLYGYAFETPDRGHLLLWKDGRGNRDSAGIYIAGSFKDSVNFLELVSADTALYTEVLFPNGSQSEKSPISYGFQRHSTLLFRETAGDTVTYYHFSRGVGCLAVERSIGGRLIAAGTIKSFYGAASWRTD